MVSGTSCNIRPVGIRITDCGNSSLIALPRETAAERCRPVGNDVCHTLCKMYKEISSGKFL
jgi:hypothetical protein